MRRNAAPRMEYKGIKDVSQRTPPVIPEQMPQHLPIIYTFASTGPYDDVVYGFGDILFDVFGQDFLDYRAKHVTHATPLIEVVNRAANKMALQRLRAPNSAQARYALGLDIIADEIPLYQLDSDGFPVRDMQGALVPTGETTPGYQAKWVKFPIPQNAAFGTLAPTPGTITVGGTQSQIYPILELNAAHDGEPGNLTGFRFYAPSTLSAIPLDEGVVEDQKSMLYRLQVLRKLTPRSSPVVWETLTSAQQVEFAFNPEAINEAFDTELYADKVVAPAYRNMDLNSNGVRTYGPFEQVKFYHTHIKMLSENIQLAESTFGVLGDAEEDLYLTNVVGFRHPNGAPYQSVMVHGIIDGGLELSDISTHYLEGGDAGDMTAENFEQAVLDEILNFGNGAVKWRNYAKYPASAFYDTGFSTDVKNVIPRLTSVRNNVAVYLASHIVDAPLQTLDQESSMIAALNAKLQAYPESVIFGTSFCRGAVLAGAGQVIDSKYDKYVPATIDFAYKKALFQGAANGVWKPEFAYDQDGRNHVSILKNLTHTFRPEDVRNRDWANGAIYWQDYDRYVAFYPGLQTAYVDDTSVLNSEMVMSACCHLATVAFNVWKRLTGNQKLTSDQLIERSNEEITRMTQDVFDGRFVIVPDTMITDEDNLLGYSWSANIHIYANNMRTVFAAAVIAHRMEDLNG